MPNLLPPSLIGLQGAYVTPYDPQERIKQDEALRQAQPIQQAQDRLKQIEEYWQQYPGAVPGGTGSTGLLPNDARGWSGLLQMQTEHQNLMNQLAGKPPVTVREAGPLAGLTSAYPRR